MIVVGAAQDLLVQQRVLLSSLLSSHFLSGETVTCRFELKQLDEYSVALAHELGRIACREFFGDPRRHALAKPGVHRNAAEVTPHTFRCLPKRLVQQGTDAAGAAREMQIKERSEQGPPQARPMRNRRVDIFHARDALGNEIERLLPQRGLEPVGDVTHDLAAQMYRMFPDRPVECECALDRLRRRQLPARNLDKRDQVRWIEGMTEHDAFGMPCAGVLELADLDR